MAGHSGLAGSVTLGDGVIIGGSASIKDHTTLGSGAIMVQDQVLLATFLLVKPFWVIRL
jgi:UDP-3-O-[3-hydroxymyristoyl] glucosamine N-acyltransferase